MLCEQTPGVSEPHTTAGLFEQARADLLLQNTQLLGHRGRAVAESQGHRAQGREQRRMPAGMMREAGRAFWRPSAGDVLRPFVDAYIAAVPSMHEGGMLWAMVLSSGMFPAVGVDQSVAHRLEEAASGGGVSALVAKSVRQRVDELRRMLRARLG